MGKDRDLRASKRIPVATRVQVVNKGKAVAYALAINISVGGLLLSAAPTLPVGSPCRLTIHLSGNNKGEQLLIEGTVVRNDARGTAVKFANSLENIIYASFSNKESRGMAHTFINSYLTYFRISQSKTHEGCLQLLGVSPRTFRTVFLFSFCTCIILAILPVWFLRESIPLASTWVKIAASFGYATFWLAIIQPTVDMMVFKFLKNRNATS